MGAGGESGAATDSVAAETGTQSGGGAGAANGGLMTVGTMGDGGAIHAAAAMGVGGALAIHCVNPYAAGTPTCGTAMGVGRLLSRPSSAVAPVPLPQTGIPCAADGDSGGESGEGPTAWRRFSWLRSDSEGLCSAEPAAETTEEEATEDTEARRGGDSKVNGDRSGMLRGLAIGVCAAEADAESGS